MWHKNVHMICETCIAFKCAPKPPCTTGFDKSENHTPNLEKLQFYGNKFDAFLLNFEGMFKIKQKCISLASLACNFSKGWWISDFSKPVCQSGFGAHSKAMQVSQIIKTKCLCLKNSQNRPFFSVSYYRNCIRNTYIQADPILFTANG